jgi:uncharacterized protein YceH (UPF0502 family)
MQQPLIDIDFTLTDSEVRVLGVLMEKQITTPAYYPMSPNALTNGCNQKNSRHPVLSYTEGHVMGTLEGMRDRRLVSVVHEHGSRVPKYAQLLTRELRLEPDEHAVLCVLMLRGAQTVGELRGRCEPIHAFSSLEAVEHTLNTLASRPVKPLVVRLERLPGARDARWAHTLMGAEGIAAMQADFASSSVQTMTAPSVDPNRLEALENEVRALRAELDEIKKQLGI